MVKSVAPSYLHESIHINWLVDVMLRSQDVHVTTLVELSSTLDHSASACRIIYLAIINFILVTNYNVIASNNKQTHRLTEFSSTIVDDAEH